jgi:hypothetical protein
MESLNCYYCSKKTDLIICFNCNKLSCDAHSEWKLVNGKEEQLCLDCLSPPLRDESIDNNIKGDDKYDRITDN